MTTLDLRAWNGLFRRRGTTAWIRRKISEALARGETVIVYDTGVVGLPEKTRAKIQKGWPTSKVRMPHPHPTFTRKIKSRRRRVAYLVS